MTVIDYHNRRIPEYYDTMYMDGYEPWEILEAVHKSMRRMLAEREAEKNSVNEVKITSVIKRRYIDNIDIMG